MAFYVGMKSSFIHANTRFLSFTTSNINTINSSHNASAHAFSFLTVSEKSLYWFHLCAGVPVRTKTNYRLNGLDYPVVVYSSVDHYPAEQLTVDTLQWIKPNTTLSVSNEEPLFSSLNMETAWLGFRLDNLFNPLIVFAARPHNTKLSSENIIFDRIIVNEGNHYDAKDGIFVVPLSGIYFFSVTTSSYTGYAYIMLNHRGYRLGICSCDNIGNSGDKVSIRGSIMLTQNFGDKVHVESKPGSNYEDKLTNFHGFLYSPTSEHSVAWSVSQLVSIRGPDNNVNFSIINVNEPDCWKASLSKVIIPKTGMYYVDICSYFCGIGFYYCPGDGNGEMQVLRNDNPIIIIRRANATLINCVSRSRAVIVNLNVNDELKIAVPTKGCIYSDHQRQVSFNGFMLNGSI